MYDEFIKRLKEKAEAFDYDGWVETASDYEKAADAIEELSRENESLEKNVEIASCVMARRWIPVTKRLPEEMDRLRGEWSAEIRPSDDVLVWLSPEKRQSVAWYSHAYNEWITVDENTVYCFEQVTHWMPLPEPPKEET